MSSRRASVSRSAWLRPGARLDVADVRIDLGWSSCSREHASASQPQVRVTDVGAGSGGARSQGICLGRGSAWHLPRSPALARLRAQLSPPVLLPAARGKARLNRCRCAARGCSGRLGRGQAGSGGGGSGGVRARMARLRSPPRTQQNPPRRISPPSMGSRAPTGTGRSACSAPRQDAPGRIDLRVRLGQILRRGNHVAVVVFLWSAPSVRNGRCASSRCQPSASQ